MILIAHDAQNGCQYKQHVDRLHAVCDVCTFNVTLVALFGLLHLTRFLTRFATMAVAASAHPLFRQQPCMLSCERHAHKPRPMKLRVRASPGKNEPESSSGGAKPADSNIENIDARIASLAIPALGTLALDPLLG